MESRVRLYVFWLSLGAAGNSVHVFVSLYFWYHFRVSHGDLSGSSLCHMTLDWVALTTLSYDTAPTSIAFKSRVPHLHESLMHPTVHTGCAVSLVSPTYTRR